MSLGLKVTGVLKGHEESQVCRAPREMVACQEWTDARGSPVCQGPREALGSQELPGRLAFRDFLVSRARQDLKARAVARETLVKRVYSERWGPPAKPVSVER